MYNRPERWGNSRRMDLTFEAIWSMLVDVGFEDFEEFVFVGAFSVLNIPQSGVANLFSLGLIPEPII